MSDFIKWLYTNYIKPHLDTIPKGEGKIRSFGLFFALLLLKHPAGADLCVRLFSGAAPPCGVVGHP